MKTLKIAWMLGFGFCLNAMAEGFLPEDRPVDAEDVPEFLMNLKDLSNAEEAMILEALGLIKGKDGELELAAGDELFENAGQQGNVKIRKKLLMFKGGPGEKARVELEVLPEGNEVDVERLFLGGKGGALRLMDVETDYAMKLRRDLVDWKARQGSVEAEPRWMIGAVINPDEKGVLVVKRVMPGSPSEKAGMQAGDRLRSINGIKLRDFDMLTGFIQLVRDQELYFVVERGEGKKKLKVKAQTKVHLQHQPKDLEQVEELKEEKVREKVEKKVREKVEVRRVPQRRPAWDGRKEREFRALQDELKRLKQRVEKLEK